MYHVGMHMSGGSWDLRCNACVVRSTRTECDMGGPRPSPSAQGQGPLAHRPHEGMHEGQTPDPHPPQRTQTAARACATTLFIFITACRYTELHSYFMSEGLRDTRCT